MKLSNEELSLLLGEHSAKRMRRGGYGLDGSKQCMLQVINKYWNNKLPHEQDTAVINWFDSKYVKKWSPDEFLSKLETECP